MTAALKIATPIDAVSELLEDVAEPITDPGIPSSVDGEATRLIKLVLNSMEEKQNSTEMARKAARRLRSVCTPVPRRSIKK